MIADLFEMPASADLGLRCTNLRTMDGKRPVFVDDQHSFFFFPYLNIRFVEIPPASLGRTAIACPSRSGLAPRRRLGRDRSTAPEEDLEIDEDFLRRIREV